MFACKIAGASTHFQLLNCELGVLDGGVSTP